MRLIFISLIFCVLFFTNCKKITYEPELPDFYRGTVKVDKNNTPWKAFPSASINNRIAGRFNMAFDSLDKAGFLRAQCAIYKIPTQPGTYPIQNTSIQSSDTLVGAQFFYIDIDFLLGDYNILESDSSSFITILSYDSITNKVSGNFDITFRVVHKPYFGAPDTIQFRNGIFHTKIAK